MQGSSPCSISNAKNVNNASALRACITYSAPLRALGVSLRPQDHLLSHMTRFVRALFDRLPPLRWHVGVQRKSKVAVYVVAQYSHHGRKGVGIVIVDTHDNTRHITGGTIPTYLLSWIDSFATNSRRRSRAFFPGTVPGPRRAFVERLHGSPQGVYRRIQQRPRDGGFGVRPTRQ